MFCPRQEGYPNSFFFFFFFFLSLFLTGTHVVDNCLCATVHLRVATTYVSMEKCTGLVKEYLMIILVLFSPVLH